MSRDEILNMPAGREIDALVAEKVMGWHLATDKDGWKKWVDEYDCFMRGMKQDDSPFSEDDEDFNLLHWHPSESILWAWEVVEKLAFYQIITKANGAGYSARVNSIRCEAPTAPLAICRAALLAVMEN